MIQVRLQVALVTERTQSAERCFGAHLLSLA